MSLSKEFLSFRFMKLAEEYVGLGLFREAEIALHHAADVRRLKAPRVLYVTEESVHHFYFGRPGIERVGPFRDCETALNAAWRHMERTRGEERPYAVVVPPPKKVAMPKPAEETC